MKLLNMSVDGTFSEYDLKAIPANLHDTADEVYDDKLYSLYTVSNTIIEMVLKAIGLVLVSQLTS